MPGKSLTTVGVGPKLADGMIRVGRKECGVCRYRVNSCRWDVVRLGVRCEVDKEYWRWVGERGEGIEHRVRER